MTPQENAELIYRVIVATWTDSEGIHWWPNDKTRQAHVYAIVNDVFAWGCADLEEITTENIDAFETAFKEVQAASPKAISEMNVNIGTDAATVFACRIRKQRPFKDKGTYPVHASVVPLIEALPFPDNTRAGSPT